ncbi:type II toxin-antitoxin system Phd/YefM family antitoxin [Pararhizobium arenae]|jgi:antitoxin (DNA-binding transcriptional repressor) of toxin-antitoxin stability system|uniref:type II toxin-antitoxin system Phd/YefM family antitoxin n=1 Tax=Pararhizobium arenae TaxID=1856850 RepID=UPI00094B412A|nr:type II toxin-antitoxin system prevent-host-death family antitoxin [Pararhizobium arenae]
MRKVGAFEAKNTFGTLLELVESGEEIVITRHGKPVARMIREAGSKDAGVAKAAAEGIRELAKSIRPEGFDWLEWKGFRDEGRR